MVTITIPEEQRWMIIESLYWHTDTVITGLVTALENQEPLRIYYEVHDGSSRDPGIIRGSTGDGLDGVFIDAGDELPRNYF